MGRGNDCESDACAVLSRAARQGSQHMHDSVHRRVGDVRDARRETIRWVGAEYESQSIPKMANHFRESNLMARASLFIDRLVTRISNQQ
jgi:hypothetical protein